MIRIRKEFAERMIEHARREYPNEACGILAGKNGAVEKVYEMTNTEKSPQTYFMDGKEQLATMKEMRSLGLEMMGIYHSHVASQAYPSGHDVKMAFYPDASYVIVSLKDKVAPSIRSFKIADGKIREEEIESGE
jgi:proteasome lid subunit RPN8/RPN11